MGFETATWLLLGSIAAGTAGSVVSTVAGLNQADAQSKAAEQNAQVARQNAALAEEEARQARREGHENKLKKRQEVAGLIGTQRAQQGASGALADSGSFMDTILDTVDKGESDAMALERQGMDIAYSKDMEAWNYGNQARSYQWHADQAKSSKSGILLSGGMSLLGNAVTAGSNWYDRTQKDSLLKTGKTAAGSTSAGKPFNGVGNIYNPKSYF